MSERTEKGKDMELQVRSRWASTYLKKSYHAAQVHPLVCLALLMIAGAVAVPYGKSSHAQRAMNAPRVLAAPQSLQLRQNFSLSSTMPAKPARAKSRPAPVPPVPPSPTGPPNAPVLFAPSNGTSGATVSPTLDVSVTDPAGSNLNVTFYGRVASTVGPDFTVVALPDTQYYSSSLNGGTPALFNAQTQWIVNNKNSLNIAYVAHLGDIVQSGDNGGNTSEWSVADGAMKILENAGIPYGVHPGNHDEGMDRNSTGDAAYTVLYNTYFGVSRFSGRSYYGGNYGTNNNNHYDLFSAGGMNFVVIYFAYDYNNAGSGLNTDFPSVLAWAQGVLKQYSDRHAILVSHYMMGNGNPANLSIQGGAIVNGLDGIPNVFLTLAGHYNTLPGEGQRTSVVSGNTVQGLMSDYQDQPNGGNGWLRIMTFSPSNNQINVQTYSPVLNQYMTDTASQFSVPWNMQNSGYTNLGTVSSVPSGGQASVTWNNLAAGTQYQWYAVVSNGTFTTTGPTWNFTTSNSSAPAVSLSKSSLSFGSQVENTGSPSQGVTLTNTGSATLNINSITASNDYSVTNTCGSQVNSGNGCNLSVTFTPTVTGTDNGTVTISDDAGSGSQTISLTGSGVAAAPVATLSKTSLSFTSQTVNTTSAPQTVTLTNTGNTSLSIQSMVTTGDFAASSCPSSLGINGVCTISVTFTPTTTGTRNGSITITDNAGGSPQTISLTGSGVAAAPVATLSKTSLSFANQTVNTTSAPQTVTLTNTGNTSLSIQSMVTTGDFAASSCPSSLGINGVCTISVTFTPTTTGTRNGSIAITDNAGGSPQTISLTGLGGAAAPVATLSKTSLSFTSQTVNTTSAPQTVTLTNTGNTSLSIQSMVTTGDFAASSCPSSLGINGVCTISVTFTPTTTGTRNGSITITDNAGGSPQSVTLTGTGASTTAPSITSLAPTSGSVGTAVTIAGSGFGASQSSSTVKFNGTTATPTSWSATSIVAPVPSAATTGSVVVTVGGVASNGVNFTVGARTIFLGDSNIEASEDDNSLGQAQAWPFTASTTGTVSTLWFYADPSSGNGPYLEGIYSDAGGGPGTLLSSGSVAATAAGKWNSMTLAAPLKVTAGVRYWIALLGVSGNTVHFRDVRFQQTTCTSPGSQTGLKALPAAWITTASWSSCPGSVYGSN